MALLLAPLLLLPAAAADPLLDVDHVEAEGTVHAENRLAALGLRVAYDGDPPRLSGHGAQVRIETDHQASNQSVGPVSAAPEHWTSQDHEGSLSFETAAVRGGADLFIAATLRPDMDLAAGRLNATPSSIDHHTQHQFVVQDRDPLTVDVASEALIGPDTGSRITLNGSFVLSLWEWDLIVEDGSGELATVRSGEQREHMVPPAGPAPAVSRSHARHVYLFIQDGTLELTWPDTLDAAVYATPHRWSVDGTVRLQGIAGETQDRVEHGDHLLRFGQVEDAIQVRLDAPADQPADTPATIAKNQPGPGGALWLLPVLLVVLVGGYLGARWTVRRRDLRELTALESALGLGAAEMVAEASRPRARGPHASRWAVLHVAALLRSVRYADAVTYLEADPCPRLVPVGVYHYLLAAAHAGTGDREKARAAMCLCLSEAPQMQEELAGNPLLEGLLGGRTLPEGYA